MGYERMIAASMKVIKPNVLELHPGGWYDRNEDNYVEEAVVKLHMLSQFCDMMAASYSCTSENQIIYGKETMELANKLYGEYQQFIEAGLDIFSREEFYDRKQLDKYKARPIVNGEMNAAPGESPDGIPEGWFYEWPGQLQKMFDFGFVCIDQDECVRVGIYEHGTDEQPIDMIYITQHGDYRELYKRYLNNASEIATCCDFIYREYNQQ